MTAGAGFEDANGIRMFGEADTEVEQSDLLNLGMASVSAAVGQIKSDIQDLEDAGPGSDGVPFRMASGRVGVTAGAFVTVTLPAGRFTQPPNVLSQIQSGAGGAIGATILVTSITTASFLIRCSYGAVLMWQAVQMREDSADG